MAQARLPSEAFAPLTAEGVMRALDHYGIQAPGFRGILIRLAILGHLIGAFIIL